MIKKISYLIGAVLLLLILIYICRYKLGSCICNTIPQDAEAVIQINTRSLEKYLLHDFLAHPLSYFSGNQNEGQDSLTHKNKTAILECLTLPKALLFYRQGAQNSTWTSSELAIKNISLLKQYLKENDFVSKEGNSQYTNRNQKAIIKDDKLIFIYNNSDNKAEKYTAANTTFLKEGDSLFDAVKSNSNDAFYYDSNDNKLNLDFRTGEIILKGNYDLDYLKPAIQNLQSSGIGQLSTQINLPELLDQISPDKKDKFTKFSKLNLDTLSPLIKGDIHLLVNDFKVSKDTVVTYDYDDNFNKVEVKEVKENTKPDYTLAIGMQPEAVAYMKRKKAIIEKEGKDILAIMPLVTTYCQYKDEVLYLYSMNSNLALSTSSAYKFILDLDMDEYPKMGYSGSWNRYLQDLEDFRLTVDLKNRIDGQITLRERVNPIVSIIKR